MLKDYKDKIKISEKDLNKMLEFIAENYFILMKHWNKEIDDFEVLNELKLMENIFNNSDASIILENIL